MSFDFDGMFLSPKKLESMIRTTRDISIVATTMVDFLGRPLRNPGADIGDATLLDHVIQRDAGIKKPPFSTIIGITNEIFFLAQFSSPTFFIALLPTENAITGYSKNTILSIMLYCV